MATDPARTYPSELPVLALRQTVVFPLTLQPLAINRAVSIEVGEPRARRRPAAVPGAAEHRQRRAGAERLAADRHDRRDPPDGEGAQRRHPRHRRGAVARARRRVTTSRARRCRRPSSPLPERVERTLEVDAYVRRLQRADRSRAVADERPVAGAARHGGRHRRPAAARLPAREPARHEGRREAADPRSRRPQRRSCRRCRPRSTARSRCSS